MYRRTWTSVISQRLARNHLMQRGSPTHMVDVVRAVCGLQAQVMTAAELALHARIEHLTQPMIQHTLWEQRQLVKTYSLRGTVHLHPAEDIRQWVAARHAYAAWQDEHWAQTYQLEPRQIRQVLAAMRDALDGCQLTRADLAQQVAKRVGAWAHARLASTWADLIRLGFDAGVLCFGPNQGAKTTFVRLDQWIGPGSDPDPQDALRWIVRHFLATYGPTTPRAFARWFAAHRVKPQTLDQLTALFKDESVEVTIEGQRAWSLAADLERVWASVQDTVRLLPQYDSYLLSGRFGRDQIVSETAREHIFAYKNGRFEGVVGVPIVLIDGRVAGMWERQQQRGRLEIRIEPFVSLTATQRRQLDREVERIGSFFQTEARLVLMNLV